MDTSNQPLWKIKTWDYYGFNSWIGDETSLSMKTKMSSGAAYCIFYASQNLSFTGHDTLILTC